MNHLKKQAAMTTFIEDYLHDPASAIQAAFEKAERRFHNFDIDDELIYKEIASSEFRLYEEIVMCDEDEITPHASGYAVVA